MKVGIVCRKLPHGVNRNTRMRGTLRYMPADRPDLMCGHGLDVVYVESGIALTIGLKSVLWSMVADSKGVVLI